MGVCHGAADYCVESYVAVVECIVGYDGVKLALCVGVNAEMSGPGGVAVRAEGLEEGFKVGVVAGKAQVGGSAVSEVVSVLPPLPVREEVLMPGAWLGPRGKVGALGEAAGGGLEVWLGEAEAVPDGEEEVVV